MSSKLKFLTISYFLSLILSQTVYSSNPESYLLFSINKHNIARIGIVNRENLKYNLVIKNSIGEVLFIKNVSKYEDYFDMLSLSNMPDGEYLVTLVGGDKSYEKKFSIQNSIASVVKKQKEVKPFFKLVDEDILLISYLNAELNNVNIFFELNDDIVFEERNITGNPVSKKYSLSKLPDGEYIVKLYSGSRIYKYPLAVQ